MIETEEQALIAAVLANPNDSLPQLVYADWLEESPDTRIVCNWCKGSCVDQKREYTLNGQVYIFDHSLTPCPVCKGEGHVPSENRQTADWIRLSLDLEHRWPSYDGVSLVVRRLHKIAVEYPQLLWDGQENPVLKKTFAYRLLRRDFPQHNSRDFPDSTPSPRRGSFRPLFPSDPHRE